LVTDPSEKVGSTLGKLALSRVDLPTTQDFGRETKRLD